MRRRAAAFEPGEVMPESGLYVCDCGGQHLHWDPFRQLPDLDLKYEACCSTKMVWTLRPRADVPAQKLNGRGAQCLNAVPVQTLSRHLHSPPRIRLTGSGPREWRTVPFPRAHRGSLLFTQGTARAFTSERRMCSLSEQALRAGVYLTLGGDEQGKKWLPLPLTCTSHDGQGDSDPLAKGTALPVPPRKGQRVPKRNTLGVPRRNALRVPKRNGMAAEFNGQGHPEPRSRATTPPTWEFEGRSSTLTCF